MTKVGANMKMGGEQFEWQEEETILDERIGTKSIDLKRHWQLWLVKRMHSIRAKTHNPEGAPNKWWWAKPNEEKQQKKKNEAKSCQKTEPVVETLINETVRVVAENNRSGRAQSIDTQNVVHSNKLVVVRTVWIRRESNGERMNEHQTDQKEANISGVFRLGRKRRQ